MFTAHIECPRAQEPVYFQKCRSLAKAGFPFHAAGISRRNSRGKSARRRKFPKPTPELIFISARSRPPITRNCRRRSWRNSSRRSPKIFPKKNWCCPARPTEREQGKNGGIARVASAKTVARFRREFEPHADCRRHPTQRTAFLRRHRHAPPRGDDADAGRRVVLAEPRLARMGAGGCKNIALSSARTNPALCILEKFPRMI